MNALKAFLLLSFLLTTLLSGCYGQSHYATMSGIQQATQHGEYERAKEFVEMNTELRKERNALLYTLELGVLNHLNGDYRESNQWLEKAAARMEELDVISLSGLAADWIFSERFHPYRGEDYERVLVHYYMTLNYLMMGQLQEALVECRRFNSLLQQFHDRYDEKSVYKSDAFMLYLSGLIYDAMGELNDAFIDYRHAYESYRSDYRKYYATPLPPQLPEQLLRTSDGLSFFDYFEDYRQEFPGTNWPTQQEYRHSARLVVIWNKGLIPYKVEKLFRWYTGWNDIDRPGCYIKFGFAELVPRIEFLSRASVTVNGQTRRLELAEELGKIAQKNLEDRRLRTAMHAASRNIIKCAAEQAMEEQHWIWGWIFAGATELTEGVDVRHWFLLPAEMHITHMLLPPGTSDVELNFSDPGGNPTQQTRFENVRLQAGKTTFLIHRTF
ncbi:MAG: hypothetical protein GY801_18540 [bacterium]|nr:hypothetical protein [bacterium]